MFHDGREGGRMSIAGALIGRDPHIDRLMAKVDRDPDTGCWLWTGALHKLGYGRFRFRGRVVGPHQAAYALSKGDVPPGAELDHKCRVRRCCNPDHLEPVTHVENMARGINATKTYCKHGHEFTPENTYRSRDGRRHCRQCNQRRNRKYRSKKHSGGIDGL